MQSKPAVKKVVRGVSYGGISINGTSNQETTKATALEAKHEVVNKELVNAQQLVRTWNKMVKDIAAENVLLAQSLQSHQPTLDENGTTIGITLHNSYQETRIVEEQQAILKYLRENLKNDTLSLSISINETQETKKPFTASEKVQIMVKKNPDLNTLRKMFDLDLE